MLRELQQNGTSLSKVCHLANHDIDCTTDKSYYWHDGLLYHFWKPHGQDAEIVVNQLVLPEQCRGKVLKSSSQYSFGRTSGQGENKTENHAALLLAYPV